MTRLSIRPDQALTDRQSRLLSNIVEEYLKTAEPVGSANLVERAGLGVSPATIRSEMQQLEEAGYLEQPHTSAGRIPTVQAWREYLKGVLPTAELAPKRQQALAKTLANEQRPGEEQLKALARALAEFVGEAVFVGFSPHDVYYTGLSNLFRKPEFEALDLIRHLTDVVDRLDDVVEELTPKVQQETVLLGSDNPFAEECGVIVTRYTVRGGTPIVGVLGPVRQDYVLSIGALRFVPKLLEP